MKTDEWWETRTKETKIHEQNCDNFFTFSFFLILQECPQFEKNSENVPLSHVMLVVFFHLVFHFLLSGVLCHFRDLSSLDSVLSYTRQETGFPSAQLSDL